ncbi:FG-GAP repeat domain-containing protein [Dictyobacter formicarum]|uniref:VCBS repeat-containing protein n=1 Tax=Dictyobacter formicarum TaxID=2778368 RepID=A0ABQ3VJW9_9CHLR|nr:VCBS repeat-containing protein [Dictyobacter formicarum]GHO85411.1 hypothetical protein KSZ_34170 [Dictyobacter formicarum]
MAADGEQSASRRRARGMTGSQTPHPSVYQRPMSRADTSPHTDGYRFDEGMIDPPRSSSSVVRFTNTQPPRYPNTQLGTSAVPARRQGMTKDLPPQMRSTGHTGRQPRLPMQPPQVYTTAGARNVGAKNTRPSKPPVKEKPSRRVHWLLPAGVGMVAMLVLWVLGSTALSWGIARYNDFKYGYPRTYQTDAVVGHNDSPTHKSHFIAINYNHQAVVMEMMGGDTGPGKSISYVVNLMSSDSVDLAPVTVDFKDLNGDGKPDMIVHVHLSNQDQVSVFINDGKKFRPTNANDKFTAPIN